MQIIRGQSVCSRQASASLVSGAVVALLVVAGALGCAGAPDGPKPPTGAAPQSSPFVVSAPHAVAGAGTSGASRSTAGSAEARVTYVSLPPGAIPNADVITIRVQSSGVVVTANAVDAGLDPVAVPAAPGDILSVTVSRTGGVGPVLYMVPVPRVGRPVVVRTAPPPKKRDVPLNLNNILVVFSEPIAEGSLTPTAVRLTKGETPVPGQVGFGDPAHLTSTLTLTAALAPATEYTLTITQEIQNLDGESLSEPVTVQFTTAGQTVANSPITYQVTGTVTDEDGAPLAGAQLLFDFLSSTAPGAPFSQIFVKSDADGKFRVDATAVLFRTHPPGMDDAFAMVWTGSGLAYDFDYRYVLASAVSDMRIMLHRRTQIVAGDSVQVTIVPDDAICTNNVQDMHPWPAEWVCRTVYIVPPADGTVIIYAGACPQACVPVGLEAEPADSNDLYWSLYPATGMLDVPAKRGSPIRLQLEIPWGSPRQSFMLRTALSTSGTEALYAFAALGDTATALGRLRELQREHPKGWLVATTRAYVMFGIGDTTEAMKALERARDAQELWPAFGSVLDPMYDPVRSSARFHDLLRSVNLPLSPAILGRWPHSR